MISNTATALPLCSELENWCRAEKLPYIRADDLLAKGFITPAQRAWLQDFQKRWDSLKNST